MTTRASSKLPATCSKREGIAVVGVASNSEEALRRAADESRRRIERDLHESTRGPRSCTSTSTRATAPWRSRSATMGRKAPTLAAGRGIVGLQDRIDVLGGRMEIAGPAGGGTTLRVTLPG
jgi:signal transduction histidine kinase